MPVEQCGDGWRWGSEGHCYEAGKGGIKDEADAKRHAFLQGLAEGDTQKMSDRELDAARAVGEHVGIQLRKDASTGSLIIGWFPWDGDADDDDVFAEQLALPSGTSAQDLHLTLLYLGDPNQYDAQLIAAALKIFTAQMCWPIQGKIAGLGRFVGEGDQDVLVALVDCPDIGYLRNRLLDCLANAGVYVSGYDGWNNGHGFIPHITLAYVPRTQSSPEPFKEATEFTIDALSIAVGPDRAQFEFPQIDEADDAPFFAARNAISKAGKMISAKNMGKIKAAVDALQELMTSAMGDETVAKKADPELTPLEYTISKSRAEDRYTFGPLYSPDALDAHDEFTDAETLQKAVWEYVRESADNGRRLNLQHDDSGNATCGEWVEVVSWPYEAMIKVRVPGEDERTLTLPAGTTYMGVIWDEEPWEQGVKKGKITGLSLGGRTLRVSVEEGDSLPSMGDKLAAKMHTFEESADDSVTCSVCGKAMGDGDHYGE